MRRVATALSALAFLWAGAATLYLLLGAGHDGVTTATAIGQLPEGMARIDSPLVSPRGVWAVTLLSSVTLLSGLPVGVGLTHPSAHRWTSGIVGSLLLVFSLAAVLTVGLFYLPVALILLLATAADSFTAVGRAGPVVALLLLAPSPSAAQEAQPVWPVWVEATVGRGWAGSSGRHRDEGGGTTADALLGVRVASWGDGSAVAAASLGIHGTGDVTTDCILLPGGGCLPSFPELTVASLLGGWETADGALRALAGPALARPHGDWDALRPAFAARMEGALRLGPRFWVVGSLRGVVVPSYREERHSLGSVGLGVRVR